MRAATVVTAMLVGGWALLAAGPRVLAAEPDGDRSWIERSLVAALSERLGGPVRFERLEVDWLRLEARFEGGAAEVRAGGAPPAILRVRSGRLRLAWTGLPGLAAGRVRITAIELSEPRIELTGEFLRAWSPRPGAGRKVEVRIDATEVRGGTLVYRDAAEGFSLDVSDVTFAGSWSPYRRALVGEGRGAVRLARSPIERPLPLRFRGGLRIRERGVEFFSAEIDGPDLRAGVEGRVTWGAGTVLSARALVDGSPSGLGPFLDPAFPALGGTLAAELRVDRPARGPVTVAGVVRTNDVRFGPLAASRAEGEMLYREGRLALSSLVASAYGGKVSAEVEVWFGAATTFRAGGEIAGADARSLLRLAGPLLPVAARADGRFDLTGEPGRIGGWRGEAQFVASEAPVDAERLFPASGSGRILFGKGRTRTAETRLRMAGADLSLDLDLPLEPGASPGRFEVRGGTADARRTRGAVVSLLEAFDVRVPDFLREDLSGRGSMRALAVLGSPPELEVDLALTDGGWAGEAFDRGKLELAMRDGRVEVRDLALAHGDARLFGTARLALDPFELEAIDVQANAIPLSSVLAPLGATTDIDGSLSGRIRAERIAGTLRGDGEAVVARGAAFGEPFERLSGRFEMEGDRVRLDRLEIHGPAGEATGDGELDLGSGALSGRISAGRVGVERSAVLGRAGVPLSGSFSLRGTWGFEEERGPWAELHLEADRVEIPGMLPDGTLGGAAGSLRWAEGAIDLALGWPVTGWEAAARIALEPGYFASAVIRLDRLYVSAPASAEAGMGALLGGTIRVEGPLARPTELEAEGSLTTADLDVSGRTFRAVSPIAVALAGKRLRIGPAGFSSEGAAFGAELAWDLDTDRLEGALRGEIDLALASLLRREIRASGRLTADLALAGTREEPEIRGRVEVADGRLRWLGLREGLDGVVATVAFAGRKAELSTFRALSGGGEIEGTGSVLVGVDGVPDADLRFRLSGVPLELPEHFRGIYDGTIGLVGTPAEAVLSGDLALIRGVYAREFDLAALATGASRELESDAPALPSGVRLDLSISAPDNVWIKNNLARVEGTLGLRITGDLRRPEIVGRVGVFEGGRIRFRDVDYRVLSGSLEFDERDRIDPFMELEGETRVRDYDVRLRIAGKLDRFEYELTSQPSLPQSDIVYLLLTGSVPYGEGRGEAASGAGATGDLAADYFAGVLTGTLSRQVERALGLDQFRINPLLEGQVDPTARITVGKQVTDRLRILYSADVGSSERQLYQAEWDASRRFSVGAERDTTGGYGASLRFSDRYGRGGGSRRGTDTEGRGARRFRIDAVEIEGVSPPDADRLRRKSRLDPGDLVGRGDVFLAAEAIRADRLEQGRLGAKVSFEIEEHAVEAGEEAAVAGVLFQVVEGPIVRVRLVGVEGRLARQIENDLEDYWLEAVPVGSLFEEAAERVRALLRARGHYAADVVAEASGDRAEQTLTLSVDAGPVVRPSRVRFEGLSQLSEERVRRQVLTGRTEGLLKRPISPEVLQEDARAIATLYRSEGFLDADVAPPQVRLAVDGSSAEVLFRIDAGTRYLVGEIEIEGAGPGTDAARVSGWSGLTGGQPVSAGALARAETAVRDALDREGYPEARVLLEVVRRDGLADVRIRATPGPRKRFAGLVVRGAFRTREKIVRREIDLRPGDPISAAELLRTQHRLYRLGLFRSVRIGSEPAPDGDPENWTVVVTVEEGKPIALAAGIGYDTEAGARVSFGIGHDNLWGLDRGLTLQARRSDLERRVQLVAKDPWLFGRRLDSTANFYWERLEEVGFTVERRAFAFRVERRLGSAWTRFLRYNYQKVDLEISNPSDDVTAVIREQKLADLRLSDLGVTLARDTRDDPFLPKKGGTLLGEARLFHPSLASDASFLKIFLQGSATLTFPRRTAYSVAVRIGAAKSFGDTESVPISERFFAGGESTLRGFRRDTLGLVVDDFAVGGEGLFLLNQEVRFPVWRSLVGVVFTDWGNVFTDLSSFDPTDLRYTAGAGLRFETPIGPLRLEYGRKLDRRIGESPGEFYFAIGTMY